MNPAEQAAIRAHLDGYYAQATDDSYPGWLRRRLARGRREGRHDYRGEPLDIVREILSNRGSHLIERPFVRRRDGAWVWEPDGLTEHDRYLLSRLAFAADLRYSIEPGRYAPGSTVRIVWIPAPEVEPEQEDLSLAVLVLATLLNRRTNEKTRTKEAKRPVADLSEFASEEAFHRAAKIVWLPSSGDRIGLSKRLDLPGDAWRELIDWIESVREMLDLA
ncbi:MAG TPA: hypothetical protein DDW52_22755, partial [Planctomycetaceae bacterium]|nr:hypothetical protein [Planctomycetaceae bacterium]